MFKRNQIFYFLPFFIVVIKLHMMAADGVNSIYQPLRNCLTPRKVSCKRERFIDAYPELSKSKNGAYEAETYFAFFTRKNKDEPEYLHECGGRLPDDSYFNPDNRVIVLTHGLNSGYCYNTIFLEIKNELLKREDCNLILLEWTWGNNIDMYSASQNLEIIGQQLAQILKNIREDARLSHLNIYLIGHSYGAQISGFTGFYYDGRITRITGLDPGRAFFLEDKPLAKRLDSSDGDLVDVIHTNAGPCLASSGIDYNAGHVDIYVNDGSTQLSCYDANIQQLLLSRNPTSIVALLIPRLCFHNQALVYYKLSINPENCQYVGVKCKNKEKSKSKRCRSCGKKGDKCLIMGYDFAKYYEGPLKNNSIEYYVKTDLICPYCDNSGICLGGFKSTYQDSLQN